MMLRLKRFLKTTLLGGVIVALPVVMSFLFLSWLYNLVVGIIEPITVKVMAVSKQQKFIADFIVVLLIILICFLIGLLVKTSFGHFIHQTLEKRILKVAPGYSLFKETIKQFLGTGRAPFSRVALVRIYQSRTLMTGFVTDQHASGWYTVYVPSGLNPTTGMIYHLEAADVYLLNVGVEDAMRTVISCGGGSQLLLEDFLTGNSVSTAADPVLKK